MWVGVCDGDGVGVSVGEGEYGTVVGGRVGGGSGSNVKETLVHVPTTESTVILTYAVI